MDEIQFKAWMNEINEQNGNKSKLDTLCKDMECIKKDLEQLKKVEPCPSCEKKIPSDSLVCPYCKAQFEQNGK